MFFSHWKVMCAHGDSPPLFPIEQFLFFVRICVAAFGWGGLTCREMAYNRLVTFSNKIQLTAFALKPTTYAPILLTSTRLDHAIVVQAPSVGSRNPHAHMRRSISYDSFFFSFVTSSISPHQTQFSKHTLRCLLFRPVSRPMTYAVLL